MSDRPKGSNADEWNLFLMDHPQEYCAVQIAEALDAKMPAIHLNAFGNKVTVSVEVGGKWVEVIREHYDGTGHASHIVEPGGIQLPLLAPILRSLMRELNPCHHGNAIDRSRSLSCAHCEGEKDLMRDAVRWRDDAFEASAQIVERYFGAEAGYCTGDIRALKSSVAKPNS